MNDTVVVTSIYSEFWGTEEFTKSVKRVGLPLHNAFKGPVFTGNGNVMRMLYEAYVELKDQYKYAIYSDGADTIFLKSFTPPWDKLIFSAEKAVWPPLPELKEKWDNFYKTINYTTSPWRHLNAGNACGPIQLFINFYEKYELNKYENVDVNGQGEVARAFLKAKDNGFPITLDTTCNYFQPIAHEDVGDFHCDGKIFKNLKTNTEPYVLHGNGRTSMQWLYENLNK